jgi:hypothetical protein
MRGALVTLAVGGAAAAAFFALGFGVQRVGLRSASHGSRVGANVAGLILRHRVMTSSFEIDGQPAKGLCLHHWFRRQLGGGLGLGTVLQLAGGGRVIENGGPIRFEGLERPGYLPRLILLVAGCTRDLGIRVAMAAQLDAVFLEHTTLDGKPALQLRLARIHDPIGHNRYVVDRVKVWVDPTSYEPLAVWAKIGRHEGFGRLRFEKMTPALIRRVLGSA